MLKSLYQSLVMTVLLLVVLCGFYPLLVTGVGQTLFKEQAEGSLVRQGGIPVGSALIGQNFTKPEYFHGRPSAAGEKGYDATSSSGTNLGPTNKKLADRIAALTAKVREENPDMKQQAIPVDLVTASGSGLDPHISVAGAKYQALRVAKARGMSSDEVMSLIAEHTEGPQLGFFGNAVVNVLALNMTLDARQGR